MDGEYRRVISGGELVYEATIPYGPGVVSPRREFFTRWEAVRWLRDNGCTRWLYRLQRPIVVETEEDEE